MKTLNGRVFWLPKLTLVLCMGIWSSGFDMAQGVVSFVPTYFEPAKEAHGPTLAFFLDDGRVERSGLNTGPPELYHLLRFGVNGRTIYGQSLDQKSGGLIEENLKEMRKQIIPGSEKLGTIWHVTVVEPSGSILVSGFSKKPGECGTFEINPEAGLVRTLVAGPFPGCGGGGGPISPDGKHVLRVDAGHLVVRDFDTETTHLIGAGMNDCSWSPDGKTIACVKNGKVILIDRREPSRVRVMGPSEGGAMVWSPDSSRLLLLKPQASCWASLYAASLEILELDSGKRSIIGASHCQIAGGAFGWMRPDAERETRDDHRK